MAMQASLGDLHFMRMRIAIAAISVQEQMRGWLARLNRLSIPAQLADWYDFLVNRMFPVWNRYKLLPFPDQLAAGSQGKHVHRG